MRARRTALGLVTGLALLAAACGGTSNDTAGEPTRETRLAEAVAGGEVSVIQTTPRSLDPAMIINNATQGADLINALHDVLFTVDVESGEIEPRLATAMETEDGTTWTLTLRDGLTFTDGTPLDAAAVAANWERIRTNPRGAAHAQSEQIDSLTPASATELTITLKRPNRQFHRTVESWAFNWIASPTAIEAEGDAYGTTSAVGAGPFMLESMTQGSQAVLVKNPDYWAAEQGLPKLDKLTFRFSTDAQQNYDSLATGAVDMVVFTNEAYAAQVTEIGGYSVAPENWAGGGNLLFNKNRAPFDDIRARKAVTLALDIDQLIDTVQEGHGAVLEHIVAPESPFHEPDLRIPEPDPVEAQRLFDELAAEGTPLAFNMVVSQGTVNQQVMTQFQTQLAAFDNVDARVEGVDPASYGITLYQGDFDSALYAIASPDPVPQWAQLASNYPTPIAHLGDPEIDAALMEAQAADSLEERKAAYRLVQEYMLDDWSVFWMYPTDVPAILSENVTGIVTYGQGSHLFHDFGLIG